MGIGRHRLIRVTSLGLCLLAALANCSGSDRPNADRDALAEIFNDARNNPSHRESAVLGCALTIARQDYDPGFDDMIAGLLSVPVDQAFSSYCAAMVEASITNKISASDLRQLHTPPSQRGKEPFGHMLRQVLAAHERLYAQQAQKPPQAQSCGCGQ